MNKPMKKGKRQNPFLTILVLFFFSSQLIIFPERAEAEKPCWNDGTMVYAEGKTEAAPPENKPNQQHDGDPVNIATGNFSYEHQDLFIPGRGLAEIKTKVTNLEKGQEEIKQKLDTVTTDHEQRLQKLEAV